VRGLVVVVAVAGCTVPYRGETIYPELQRFDCLDVWLQAGQRAEAEGPVVVVHLGNRCDHSVPVDLGSIRVVGLDEAGSKWTLAAYDPDHEIEPRRIDAYVAGEEWIEYHAQTGAPRFAWIDVDVGSVAGRGPERWVRLGVPR
jgi:hypothetical protein